MTRVVPLLSVRVAATRLGIDYSTLKKCEPTECLVRWAYVWAFIETAEQRTIA